MRTFLGFTEFVFIPCGTCDKCVCVQFWFQECQGRLCYANTWSHRQRACCILYLHFVTCRCSIPSSLCTNTGYFCSGLCHRCHYHHSAVVVPLLMDQLHLRTLTELLQILLAVVIELVKRFGFVPPGTPELPQHQVFCVEPCYFCGLQCRKERAHPGRHRCHQHLSSSRP